VTIKKIALGMWVQTSVGFGEVKRVGGTHPPSVRVHIVGPIPRGIVNVLPRDVERVLTTEEVAAARSRS